MHAVRNPLAVVGASNLESQLSMAVSLVNKTLDNLSRLTDLNLCLARATLEHSNLVARQLMSAEDRQELLSVLSAQTQPSARRTFDYAYYLTTIFTCAHRDVINILGEGIADTNRRAVSLVRCAGTDLFRNRHKKIQIVCESGEECDINVVVGARAGSSGGRPAAMQ